MNSEQKRTAMQKDDKAMAPQELTKEQLGILNIYRESGASDEWLVRELTSELESRVAEMEKERDSDAEIWCDLADMKLPEETRVAQTVQRLMKELAELKIRIEMLLTEDGHRTHMYKLIEENEALYKELAKTRRKVDALDKLEAFADSTPNGYIMMDRTEKGNICLIIDTMGDDSLEIFAPTLLEAIEKVEQEKKR